MPAEFSFIPLVFINFGSNAKIQHFNDRIISDDNISRFDVTMHDVVLMSISKGSAYAFNNEPGLSQTYRCTLQVVIERLPA